MTLTLGQRMVRLSDGMKGVVQQNGPELRIFWVDRGEELMAAKSEKWAPDELPPLPLREEEIIKVAMHADRALRAYERHEPMKWWEEPRTDAVPYDIGLTAAVMDYLMKRETRSAA